MNLLSDKMAFQVSRWVVVCVAVVQCLATVHGFGPFGAFYTSFAATQPTTKRLSVSSIILSSTSSNEDCGCQKFSGDVSESIRLNDINLRERIRSKDIYTLQGQRITIDDVLGSPLQPRSETSVVVFLRSLG